MAADEDGQRSAALYDGDAEPEAQSDVQCTKYGYGMISIEHFAHCDDFDSGADTVEEEGSQVTHMSESE